MIKKVISVLFVVAISLPMLVTFAEFEDFLARGSEVQPGVGEDREALGVPEPAFNEAFFSGLDQYVANNFSLRNELVQANAFVDFNLLKSSFNEDVIVGKDQWVFLVESLNGGDEGNVEAFGDWVIEAEARAQSCGAEFVFALVPDKKTLYPQYLPERIEQNNYYEALVNELNERAVSYVEFKEVLKKHYDENGEILYSKGDTHWNRLGAFIAYERLLNEIGVVAPGIKNVGNYERQGDLHRMLAVNKTEVLPDPKFDREFENLGEVIFLHDSFGAGFLPFMNNSEVTTHYLFDDWECTARTDRVIIQMVERNAKQL